MNKKLFVRFVCAILSVLTMVGVIPMLAVSVLAADTAVEESADLYTQGLYENADDFVEDMKLFYSNGTHALYCHEKLGIVAYRNVKTGETLFTNPWDMSQETNMDATIRAELMSQIIMTYSGNGETKTLNSYNDAVIKDQIIVKAIKNGLRVEYAIGEPSARFLVPMMIERTALEEKIFAPITAAYEAKYINRKDYDTFKSYFNDYFYTDANLSDAKKEAIAKKYPVTQEKNIDIYVLDTVTCKDKQKRWLEKMILTYCPAYTFEVMDNDYDFVGYEEVSISPPVFKMALEYTVEDLGLSVSLSGNGLRYDENVYRIKDFTILPYMGASYKQNEGYTFIPDGSGVLYELDSETTQSSRVYGDDFSLSEKLYNYHNETVRMPVYGQVETTYTNKTDGTWISKNDYAALSAEEKKDYDGQSRGYFAVIERGDSLAFIAPDHVGYRQYASVTTKFTTRQSDTSSGGWSVYADRRYTDDYTIRFILLGDDDLAQKAGLSSYYECSWMGMACAYRDYLDAQDNGFERLTAADVSASIPLYIETFGCMDTVEKVLSMPVTVSVALTSFEDIGTMYDYLAANGVSNVNFKLKGYANGGLYSDMPYDLDWESAVGGDGGFEDLLEKAGAAGFGIYPDFDFVYTTYAEDGEVDMKDHAARTIDNRYTSKRVYSATYQALVSYYQMVMSPVTYHYFYEELAEEYAEYEAKGISLATFGSSLNSDYDEEKTTLREEAKDYVIEGLAYFKNKGYDVMVEGGNAYTWAYADHILNVPLDSSRYNAELSAVPFLGVVLHGYRNFAGSPMNMEGNLGYAMLKAMESGASAYFVLSYANTQLLKEDEVLSQNYSVRYDIWQERLVSLYAELNSVLADVQTKLIIKHQILNHDETTNTSRLPDEDELLKDIAQAAEDAKQAIAEKLESERIAHLNAMNSAHDDVMTSAENIYKLYRSIASAREDMLGQLKYANADSSLVASWTRPALDAPVDQAAANKLLPILNAYVITPYVQMRKALADAETEVKDAKANYDKLVDPANNVNAQLCAEAKVALQQAVDNYVVLLNDYDSLTYTLDTAARDAYVNTVGAEFSTLSAQLAVSGTKVEIAEGDVEAFLFGDVEMPEHATIGVKELFDAILAALKADGYYDATATTNLIDVATLIAQAEQMLGQPSDTPVEPEPTPTPPATGEGEEDDGKLQPEPPKSKYAVDNNVVAVTYGENKDTPYKTLLLNFNDYTIKTTYNGVTYTIAAYDYVVIMH